MDTEIFATPTILPEQSKKYTLTFLSVGVQLKVEFTQIVNIGIFFEELTKELQEIGVEDVDYKAIEGYLSNPSQDVLVIAPPQPEPADGSVAAELSPDGNQVLILVEPPMGKGKKAELKDALVAIKDVGGDKFFLDIDKIENLLTSFRFRDFVIVGEKRDGSFEVAVSKDATEARLTIFPPFGGKPIKQQDILDYLLKEKFENVKIDRISEILEKGVFNQSVVIATGKKPVDGENAVIEYFFDTNKKIVKPEMDDEGNVNFRELNIFDTVRKSDVLARKSSPTSGVSGTTVYGVLIPPKAGRDIPLPLGMNCAFAENDPNTIVAGIDGQPKILNNKIHVVPIIEVKSNVDFSVGNINFTGGVNIKGSVLAGFTVKAMGDIQITGSVEGATIDAGGNINIHQGIVGQNKAFIRSRGEFFSKFIENANVVCERNIYVGEAIMYSEISCAGEIHLTGKKGYIMGGVVRAGKSVYANQVGNTFEEATVMEIGGSPMLREKIEKLENTIKEIEVKIDMYSKSLETAEKLKHKNPKAYEEMKPKILVLAREQFTSLSKLRTYKEEKEYLEEQLTRLAGTGLKLNVRDAVYPGTKICIKNAVMIIREALNFVSFYEQNGEIHFSSYEPPPKK